METDSECCKLPNIHPPTSTTVTSICPNCSKCRTFLRVAGHGLGVGGGGGGGGVRGGGVLYLSCLLSSLISCTALYRSYHLPPPARIDNDWIR